MSLRKKRDVYTVRALCHGRPSDGKQRTKSGRKRSFEKLCFYHNISFYHVREKCIRKHVFEKLSLREMGFFGKKVWYGKTEGNNAEITIYQTKSLNYQP